MAPFALVDAHEPALAVDVGDPQPQDLAEPQSAAVANPEHGAVADLRAGFQNGRDLGVGEQFRDSLGTLG